MMKIKNLENKIKKFFQKSDLKTWSGFIATIVRSYIQENQREKAIVIAFYLSFMIIPIITLTDLIQSQISIPQLNELEPIAGVVDFSQLEFIFGNPNKIDFLQIQLFSISAIILINIASRSLMTVIKAANRMYGIEKSNYFRDYLVGLLFLLIISTLTIIYNAINLIIELILKYMGDFQLKEILNIIDNFWLDNRLVLYLALIFLVFLLFYTFGPNLKLKMKDTFAGAIFSTVAFLLGGHLFIWYTSIAIYGQFNSSEVNFIFIIIFLYLIGEIILLSIRINYLMMKRREQKELTK